jgi:protein-tyrosine phosphatase
VIQRLFHSGVWMQVTAGSLTGGFGRSARYWGEKMLDEGCIHLLATDAHDVNRRPPNLSQGREFAAKRVGDTEAQHLVLTRPGGVLRNELPSNLPPPASSSSVGVGLDAIAQEDADDVDGKGNLADRGFAGRLRRIFR